MYCSITDIVKDLSEAELILLVNDENLTVTSLAEAPPEIIERIEEQIKAAESEINGYIGGRYNLPLAEVPDRVNQICKDIAIYNLYKRRHRLNMAESIVEIYKQCKSDLAKIQGGVITIFAAEPSSGQAGVYVTNKKESDKYFGKEKLDQY